MRWHYRALNHQGSEIAGVFVGSRADIQNFFKTEGLVPLITYPDLLSLFFAKESMNIKAPEAAIFFEDLSDMLKAGMSVIDALRSMSIASSNRRVCVLLNYLLAQLENGENLSVAMQNSTSFPKMVIACVNCAEQSGKLKEVTMFVSDYLKYRKNFREQISTVFFYPIFVLVILVVIMLYVAFKVIPQLKPMLPPESLDQPATRFVLITADVLYHFWYVFIFGTVLIGLIILYLLKNKPNYVEDFIYRLPLIGQVFKEAQLSLCLTHLTVLFKSGMPLIKAMAQLHAALGNTVTSRIMACRSLMIGGTSFSQALDRDVFFPMTLVLAMRKAEQSVAWDSYLDNMCQYFDKRAKSKLFLMAQLIQPILFCGCGLFLVLIGVAFLVPIYGSLSKIASG